MQSTRQRIIALLEENRTGTAAELSRLLQVTPANVRYHLDILQEQGLVSSVGQQHARGRGRPTQIFALTPTAQKDNLAKLAGALLDVLETQGDEATWNVVALKLVDSATLPVTGSSAPPVARRLYSAINRLNELHYAARWEAHATAPRLIFENCPYAKIIEKHPELCQIDRMVIEHLSGLHCQQVDKLALNPNGVRQCVFQLLSR